MVAWLTYQMIWKRTQMAVCNWCTGCQCCWWEGWWRNNDSTSEEDPMESTFNKQMYIQGRVFDHEYSYCTCIRLQLTSLSCGGFALMVRVPMLTAVRIDAGITNVWRRNETYMYMILNKYIASTVIRNLHIKCTASVPVQGSVYK